MLHRFSAAAAVVLGNSARVCVRERGEGGRRGKGPVRAKRCTDTIVWCWVVVVAGGVGVPERGGEIGKERRARFAGPVHNMSVRKMERKSVERRKEGKKREDPFCNPLLSLSLFLSIPAALQKHEGRGPRKILPYHT